MNGLIQLFNRLGLQRIAAMAVVAVLMLGFFAFLIMRASSPQMAPLYTGLSFEDSSAIVQAIAERTITWEQDPDFGYEVATSVPGISDVEKLQPRRLYERTGRMDEYRRWVERFKRERVEFLTGYEGLLPEIARAVE